MISLARIYTDDLKYSGEGESFDYKYNIFIDLCEKVEIPSEAYFKAFSTMLKGTALKHYYTSIKPNPRITQLCEICDNIRQTFEGEEFKRSMLTRWNNITLRSVIEKNPSKDIETCLQILVDELRSIQMSLTRNFQNDISLQNKLLTACQNHPACSIACSTPASSSLALINNLRSSINTYLAVTKVTEQGHI